MSKHLEEHHWNLVGHPFTSMEISNHLNIWNVCVISTIPNIIVAIASKDSFEIFSTTCYFHPRGGMTVVMSFVAVCGHFNATSVDSAVETLMEGHDFNILPLVGVGLLCELEHSLPHAVVVVVLLELNPVISTPRMDMVCIVLAPDTFWSVSRLVFFKGCCHSGRY